MNEVVIVGYLRSPMSRSRPGDPERADGDLFNRFRMDDMAATLVNQLFSDVGVDKREVDDFISGCALGVGENWSWGGRQIPLLAEFPVEVPAKQVDQQCCSSMATVHIGAMEIMLGYSNVTVSVGLEHMTHIPMANNTMLGYNYNFIKKPQYEKYDMLTAFNMGLTSEKLAEKSGITREEMDLWSLGSHKRAAKAVEEGFFKGEIMPVSVETPNGKYLVENDVSIRANTTMEGLSGLKPVFKKGGLITAGNSSPLNAGVSSMILMSKEKARELGLRPLATIRSMASAGVNPSLMGEGPVPASLKALDMIGLQAGDIDLWEINEAFAVVTLNAIKGLKIDPEKVNVKGGAIALGHPLGVTGTRIIGTVARLLNLTGKRYGLATACIGGGQGSATIIEREDYDW